MPASPPSIFPGHRARPSPAAALLSDTRQSESDHVIAAHGIQPGLPGSEPGEYDCDSARDSHASTSIVLRRTHSATLQRLAQNRLLVLELCLVVRVLIMASPARAKVATVRHNTPRYSDAQSLPASAVAKLLFSSTMRTRACSPGSVSGTNVALPSIRARNVPP